MSTGTWRDAYTRPTRRITAIHHGGPADQTTTQIPATPPQQHRFYAPPDTRRNRTVTLARYVMHTHPDADTVIYLYTGLDERHGPLPGSSKEAPAWSQ
jgi:hypothetical protein